MRISVNTRGIFMDIPLGGGKLGQTVSLFSIIASLPLSPRVFQRNQRGNTDSDNLLCLSRTEKHVVMSTIPVEL